MAESEAKSEAKSKPAKGNSLKGNSVARPKQSMDQMGADEVKNLVGTLSDEDRKTLTAELVRDSFSAEDRKRAVSEAVKSAPQADQDDIATEAARAASPEAKKAVAAAAVRTAPELNEQDIATAALESLSSQQARQEVASQFLPSQDVANQIWVKVVDAFKWVLWGATLALVAAIGVALFREVDQALVQILLTVFTTVAGIFAGFIGGKALGGSTNRPPGG